MMEGRKQAKATISEQLAALSNPEPLSFDPESEYFETSKLVPRESVVFDGENEFNDVVGPIKRRNAAALIEGDEKYRGQVSSRRKLAEVWMQEQESETNDDSEKGEFSSVEEASSDEESVESDDSEIEEDVVKRFGEGNVEDDMEKGNAIKSQIKLWDCLLETRIKLQHALATASRFPQEDIWEEFLVSGKKDLKAGLKKASGSLLGLLEDLLLLQRAVFEMNKETKTQVLSSEDLGNETEGSAVEGSPRKKLKLGENHSLEDYTASMYKSFSPFRDSVILKWDEKLRLSSGKITSKSFLSKDVTSLSRIRQVLADEDRLIKRTQLKRSAYCVLGKKSLANVERDSHLHNYDAEIFDDSDFYHQMLKELIERHSGPGDGASMGRQWLEMQRMRSKVKKSVDTKASKGRKIRYDVHTKLQSFMAPVEVGTMTDSSKNDLFSSLFGKRAA